MSTDYKPVPAISFEDIERADFRVDGVHITIAPAYEAKRGKQCCLTDGTNYMWAYSVTGEEPGDFYTRTYFARYGANDVTDLINAIKEHFNIEMISEHDEGYWEEEE